MEIYFDISDLIDWEVNHLSGIQRTVVGLLNGLVESNIDLNIIAYDEISKGFYIVAPPDISPEVHKYFSDKSKNHILKKCGIVHNANDLYSRKQENVNQFLNPTPNSKGANRFLINLIKKILDRVLFVKKIVIKSIITLNQFFKLIRKQFLKLFSKKKKVIDISENDIILSFGANWLLEKRNEKLLCFAQSGVNLYTIVYDLIPIVKHEWVLENTTKYFTKWTNIWIQHSKAVFTISEYTKNEILDYVKHISISVPDITVLRLADSVNKKMINQDFSI